MTKICQICKHEFDTDHARRINCSFICRSKNNNWKRHLIGSSNPHWSGGRHIDNGGYVLVKNNTHPFSNNHGYIREHRIIMERKIGRFLKPHEIVHHINGIKTDNRQENLELTTQGDHMRHHNIEIKKLWTSKIIKRDNLGRIVSAISIKRGSL